MTRIRRVFLGAFCSLFVFSTAQAGLLGKLPKLAEPASLYIVQLERGDAGIGQAAQAALTAIGGAPLLFEYDSVLFGFAAVVTEAQARALAALPQVTTIEKDLPVIANGTQNGAVWGLDRSDQAHLPLDGSYSYPDQGGAGVHVYVIDTGINPDHSDFAGRVGANRNFVSGGPLGIGDLLGVGLPIDTGLIGLGGTDPDNWEDCNGHGTHVSGSAAGTVYGIAKKATVHAVRVLDCQGSGAGSAILAGMEWVVENGQRPAVVNMSLGTVGGRSQAQEDAAAAMFDAGILPVVAAGNDSTDACSTSPSAEPKAVTVGSTTSADAESSFSNYGTCVDVYAPGSNIVSANYANNSGATTMSGTSMASPHVAGAVALLLGANPGLTPAGATNVLLNNATPGVLSGVGSGSPNLLLRAQ